MQCKVLLQLMRNLMVVRLKEHLLPQLDLLVGQLGRWSRWFLVLLELGSGMLAEPRVVESLFVQDLVGEVLQDGLAVVPQEAIYTELIIDFIRDHLELR